MFDTTAPPTHRVADQSQHGYPSVYFATCDCGTVGTSQLSTVAARHDMETRCHLGDITDQLTASEVSEMPGRVRRPLSGGETLRTRVWADGATS